MEPIQVLHYFLFIIYLSCPVIRNIKMEKNIIFLILVNLTFISLFFLLFFFRIKSKIRFRIKFNRN